MAKSNKAAAQAEPTRAFVVLREIKHDGKRYKEGDTIDLTYDEAVEMFGDGRVGGEFPDQQEKAEGDQNPSGKGDGAGGEQGGAGGEGSQGNGGQQ